MPSTETLDYVMEMLALGTTLQDQKQVCVLAPSLQFLAGCRIRELALGNRRMRQTVSMAVYTVVNDTEHTCLLISIDVI